MARKGKRRRMGRYIKGNVSEQLPFPALAALDVASTDFDSVVQERTLVSSIVSTYSLAGYTPLDTIGPIECGIAHGNYTAAEIEAYLEDNGTWDEGDLISQEVGKRKIRRIGTFPQHDDDTSPEDDIVVLNDGKPIKTKLNWILTQGETLQLWVYNSGATAVGGTSPDLFMTGHVNLWPQ